MSQQSPPKKPSSNQPAPTEPQIFWRIPQWFPDLPPATQAQLKMFHDELIKANKTMTLISTKTVSMADALHFADSILASREIAKTPGIAEIYDFGSGNGFPGLIYALLHPKVKVILVDSDPRKAEFLKMMIHKLGLKNASLHIGPIEGLPEHSVQFAMSRGFAPIAKAILFTRRIFKTGGRYFHLKSEEWASEVGQIPTQLCSFWSPSLVGEYKLPVGEVRFAVIQTEKTAD